MQIRTFSRAEAWPPMPAFFAELASRAAAEAGHQNFAPNVCLINRYAPGVNAQHGL
jgi:DNA oxidative demethylase